MTIPNHRERSESLGRIGECLVFPVLPLPTAIVGLQGKSSSRDPRPLCGKLKGMYLYANMPARAMLSMYIVVQQSASG